MRSPRQRTAPLDPSNYEDVQQWFKRQPREVSVSLCVRAALRTLPLMFDAREESNFLSTIVLRSFRASASSWAVAQYPNSGKDVPGDVAEYGDGVPGYVGNAAGAIFNAAIASLADDVMDVSFVAAAALSESFSALVDAADSRGAAVAAVLADMETIRGHSGTERTALALELARAKLWPDRAPGWAFRAWGVLRQTLLAADENWEVWTSWYEDRLLGSPSLGEAFDIAVATLPDELWRQGPKIVNAEIRRLIEAHTPPEPIPAQGAGPHFGLSPELKIALAPPPELDAEGNNLARIQQLLPLVRQAADDLAENLNPNTQPQVSRNLTDYRAAIAGKPDAIAWGTVFGLGVRLDNAAAAARREIIDRMKEPLEDAAQEALDSVLTLHGPLILATAEGRELSDEADRFRLTRDQQAALRADAQAIAEQLKSSPEIVEPSAADLGQKAAESIGEGDHPERGTAFGLATVKNVTTVLVSAGTLAAVIPAGAAAAGLLGGAAAAGVAWVGYEALKKSQRFTAATSALGGGFDRLHDLSEAQILRRLIALAPFRRFVRANEEPLRRIAQNSTQLRWALRYIDFIVRTSGSDDGAN